MLQRILILCAALLSALLSSCAETSTSVLAGMRDAFGYGSAGAIDAAPLEPKYRYLRLTHEGGVALLLLNFVDAHPNGAVEVWYSGDAQVFRFQNGRLAGNTGLEPEWRSVALPAFPAWSAIASAREPLHWERLRDVMPGYRFGISDQLDVYPIAPPASSALVGVDAASLQWFEERTAAGSPEPLPPARYAVRGETVVYAEQCVSARSCFKWQRWPAGS